MRPSSARENSKCSVQRTSHLMGFKGNCRVWPAKSKDYWKQMDVKLAHKAISSKPVMTTHAEGDEVLGKFPLGDVLENDCNTDAAERCLF